MRRIGLFVLGAVLLCPPAAGAAPAVLSSSVSSRTLTYHGNGSTVAIHLRTGKSAESVRLGLQLSTWQDRDMLGSPLRVADRRITGAGRLTGTYSSRCCDIAAGVSVCRRGGPPLTGDGIILTLPAESRTTVSYRVRLAAPPWPSPVYLEAVAGFPYTYQGRPEINHYYFGPPAFAIRGPTGVQIHLDAGRGAQREPKQLYPVVVARHTVQITGTTNPKLRDTTIEIAYRAVTGHRHGLIATAITDRHGAFRIAWTPATPGTYTITSSYQHPRAGLLADRNCDLALTVR
jgi:hypothetical protein